MDNTDKEAIYDEEQGNIILQEHCYVIHPNFDNSETLDNLEQQITYEEAPDYEPEISLDTSKNQSSQDIFCEENVIGETDTAHGYDSNDQQVEEEIQKNLKKGLNSMDQLTEVLSLLVLKIDKLSKQTAECKRLLQKQKHSDNLTTKEMNFPLNTTEELRKFDDKLSKNQDFKIELVR